MKRKILVLMFLIGILMAGGVQAYNVNVYIKRQADCQTVTSNMRVSLHNTVKFGSTGYQEKFTTSGSASFSVSSGWPTNIYQILVSGASGGWKTYISDRIYFFTGETSVTIYAITDPGIGSVYSSTVCGTVTQNWANVTGAKKCLNSYPGGSLNSFQKQTRKNNYNFIDTKWALNSCPTDYTCTDTPTPGLCYFNPQCFNDAPTNLELCSGDNIGLTESLSKLLVGSTSSSCTDSRKCEYYCKEGFIQSGTTCMGVCNSQGCSALGKECGTWPDGCGSDINCGSCTSPETCNPAGECVCVNTEIGLCNDSIDNDCDGSSDGEDEDCSTYYCSLCESCGPGLSICDEDECLSDLGKDLEFCDFYDGLVSNTCSPSVGKCEGTALEDTDGDGLLDFEEAEIGTDPNETDSDADGLNDYEEMVKGTNPNNPDTDADGLNDASDPNPTTHDDFEVTFTESCYKINEDYYWIIDSQLIDAENACRQEVNGKIKACCPKGKTCEEFGTDEYKCIVSGKERCSDYDKSRCEIFDPYIAVSSVEYDLELGEDFCTPKNDEDWKECRCKWEGNICKPEYEVFLNGESQSVCSYDTSESECSAGFKVINYETIGTEEVCSAPKEVITACMGLTEIPFFGVHSLTLAVGLVVLVYFLRKKIRS